MGTAATGLVDRDECLTQSDVPVIVWFLLRGLFASVGRRRGRLTAGGVCVGFGRRQQHISHLAERLCGCLARYRAGRAHNLLEY
jgi:hypothetical protein